MFNRFKLVLLLPILIALGILFAQNRQPLAIRFLCADVDRSCWYQSSELPLAVWMGIFILAGIISSLVLQFFNGIGYSASNKKQRITQDDLQAKGRVKTDRRDKKTKFKTADRDTDWESDKSDRDWNSQVKAAVSSDYEIRREPENVERSGSTYSYKFREASDRDKANSGSDLEDSGRAKDKDTLDNDDEDWI